MWDFLKIFDVGGKLIDRTKIFCTDTSVYVTEKGEVGESFRTCGV